MNKFNGNSCYFGLNKFQCFNALSEEKRDDIISEYIRDMIRYDRDMDADILDKDFIPTLPIHRGFDLLPMDKQESLVKSYIDNI